MTCLIRLKTKQWTLKYTNEQLETSLNQAPRQSGRRKNKGACDLGKAAAAGIGDDVNYQTQQLKLAERIPTTFILVSAGALHDEQFVGKFNT